MLIDYLKEPGTQRQYRFGPVGPYLDEFTRWLEQRGYRRCCIRRYLRGAHRLSMWAEESSVSLPELTARSLEAFQVYLYTYRLPGRIREIFGGSLAMGHQRHRRLSFTRVSNELIRLCLLRRQDERLLLMFRRQRKPLPAFSFNLRLLRVIT